MTMNEYPKVAIIYLTYPTANWQADINRGLASLEKINYPKDRLELVCVESKAASGQRVKDWFDQTWLPKSGNELPRITYILKDEFIGFSGNNNLGFAKAKELGCDFVYSLNEDAEVEPDFLLRAVERAEADPKIAVVQSFILLGDHEHVNTTGNDLQFLGFGYSHGYLWSRAQAEKYFADWRASNPDLEITYASGAGFLARIAAFPRGLFDDKFFSYHEDTDISLDARLRGYKVVVEPGSVVYHHFAFAKSKINYYWMERNRYAIIFSYYRWWTLLLIAPMLLVMELALIVFSLKGGWWDMKRKAYGDLFSLNFWRWIGERRGRIQNSRVVSDRVLSRQLVATIDFQDQNIKNQLLTYVGNPVMRAYWWVVKRLVF